MRGRVGRVPEGWNRGWVMVRAACKLVRTACNIVRTACKQVTVLCNIVRAVGDGVVRIAGGWGCVQRAGACNVPLEQRHTRARESV